MYKENKQKTQGMCNETVLYCIIHVHAYGYSATFSCYIYM